jgi:glycosyltransferase involved in cell wall biosynthesis
VVTDTDRRGAQVFACDLHAELTRVGHDVRTVALAPGATGGLDLPVLGSKRISAGTLRALRHEMGAATATIAHGSSTLPACAIASLGKRSPFVYRQISDSQFWASTAARRVRVRAGLRRAARVVTLWDGAAAAVTEMFGVPQAKIRVIPNAVPLAGFVVSDDATRRAARAGFGLDADRPTVLSIGALASEKGVDLTLAAVGEIPGTQLLVVGEGMERAALERLAQRVAPGRTTFAGVVDPVARAYAAADVVALPSRGGDSMPAVLIEAGLSGVPAVATPIGGIPEIVLDGESGVLVGVDAIGELTEAIRRFCDDPQLSQQFGDAARRHCRNHFTIGPIAERWLAVLGELAPDLRRVH